MNPSDAELKQHIHCRDLVNFRRAELDSNKIQGIPVAFSDKLILLRYIFDFHIDGLLLIQRSDITQWCCNETDRFQRQLLESENRLKKAYFKLKFNYSVINFESFLKRLPARKIAIVENESVEQQEFYIGRVLNTDQSVVKLHEFSGAGNWFEEPTEIATNQITSCQVDSNYIKFYERFFDRRSK